MSNPYFEYSQQVRREVEQDQILMGVLHGLTKYQLPEFLGEGTKNVLFRVGQTPSGVHIALRMPKIYLHSQFNHPDYQKKFYTDYSLAAQFLYGQHIVNPETYTRPVKFCVGLMYQRSQSNAMVMLLTEDISEGGKYEVRCANGSIEARRYLKGNFIDGVDVDLDDFLWELLSQEDRDKLQRPGYFAPQNIMPLS